jgi:hypothetical protein
VKALVIDRINLRPFVALIPAIVSGWKLEKTTALEESLLVGECWLCGWWLETPAMTPFERNNQQ